MNSGLVFYAGLLEALTQVMGTAKGYLYDHGPRVAHLAGLIGREIGLSERELAELTFGSVLCFRSIPEARVPIRVSAIEQTRHRRHVPALLEG